MTSKSSQQLHTTLERTMHSRHILMLSIGGVIGTGLFVSSGYTIQQAGPVGTILAYAIGSLIVYLVMLCLGELAVAIPESGSFHVYAKRYIGPASGFVVAIQYWLNWAVALASEFTAAGLVMQYWFPHTPAWMWSAITIAVIFTFNICSVRFFAETEFWFSSIKVVAVIAFIALGLLAIFGIIPIQGFTHAPLFTNLFNDGVFPHGLMPVFSTILVVNFAFSGTELIGVTAGETKNPTVAVPKAIHATVWRLIIFFIGSIVVMSALIPWQRAGVLESPFVSVFERLGVPYAGDIMNFVVLTALLSAANSGLYATSRMVWSLGNEAVIPRIFAYTTRHGVPVMGLVVSLVGSMLALLTSVIAADTVYLMLVAVSGLSTMVVWAVIAYCQIQLRKEWLASGKSVDELPYKTPGYPVLPWVAFGLCVLTCVLVVFDPDQRMALVGDAVLIAVCYGIFALETKFTHSTPAQQ